MGTDLNEIILRFCRDDVGGILITDAKGKTVYEDDVARSIKSGETNWASACPPLREDQRGERWDLLHKDSGQTSMVVTSTVAGEDGPLQIHMLMDSSEYMALYRDITGYSRDLEHEKDHDGLTGLYNKGKLISMKSSVFRDKDSIAVFNLDVNNLKYMNDHFGHEAGDQLIRKAAESLKRIEARNVMPFRVGGDEFMVVALHMSLEEALALRARWEEGLAELNRADDGIECIVACGFAYGERGYDLEALFKEADQRMYEDKKTKKSGEAQ